MLNKIKYRFNFLKSIFPYTKGVRRFFIFNAFLSLILTALSFINPLFYKIFIEDVIINSQFNKIIIVIIGYIGVFLLNTLIGYLNCYFNFKLVKTVLYKVKLKMWQGFFKFPFEQYDSIEDVYKRQVYININVEFMIPYIKWLDKCYVQVEYMRLRNKYNPEEIKNMLYRLSENDSGLLAEVRKHIERKMINNER